jgi:hypothetical protein
VPKGLIHLNLSHCGLSSKGVNQLAHALSLNKFMPSTLTYLNLSGNNLKEEINVRFFVNVGLVFDKTKIYAIYVCLNKGSKPHFSVVVRQQGHTIFQVKIRVTNVRVGKKLVRRLQLVDRRTCIFYEVLCIFLQQ